MKRLLFLQLALIVVGSLAGSCSSDNQNNKEKKDSIAAAKLEAARLDSIRQDSIRQDSIARRNFTSPDLSFYDLHGDVRQCDDITFDEKGNWTNEPQWSEYDKEYCPDRTKHPRVIRNNDGYITRIYTECDCDYECDEYVWDNGKVRSSDQTKKYNELGLLIYEEGEDGSSSISKEAPYQNIYYDYIIDGMGNWVKRKIMGKIYDHYELNYKEFYNGIETRTINYFMSNNGELIAIDNNSFQKEKIQAFESEKQKKEQKEQEDKKKGPEWIQGNWRCYTQYGEARVGISGNIISVWFDGEHFYTGPFEVRNDELVYDRQKGSAFTLPFDRQRKCLMMDDNHPMTKF